MIVKYLLIAVIGHTLGNFYFQSKKDIGFIDGEFHGAVSHALRYFMAFLLAILPVFSLDMVLMAIYVLAVHFIIGTVEYWAFQKRKNHKNYNVFFMGQCIHLISFFAVACIMEQWNFRIGDPIGISYWLSKFGYDAESVARWLLSILLIHKPVNIFIQSFLNEYKPKTDEWVIQLDSKAGRKIGTVERLIMLIFLSQNQFAALGFVLTAKSIARYDKIAKDERFAEYYLLGTLVSTLSVIICRILILP